MSIKAEPIEHELTVKELLELLLAELRIMRLHLEIVTDQRIRVEDTYED